MENNKDLENIINKNKLIGKIHPLIILSNKNIMFRIFPLYIRYSSNDKVIAVLFFRGKFTNPCELVLGLNLNKDPKLVGIKNANYMKDSNLTYSYLIKDSIESINLLKKVIKLIK